MATLDLSPNTKLVADGEKIHKVMKTFFLYSDETKTLLDRRKTPMEPAKIVAGTVPRLYVPTIGQIPYARALWLYFSPECPQRIKYVDGNSNNVSLKNMQAPMGKSPQRKPPRRALPKQTQAYMRQVFNYHSEHGYLMDAVTGEKKCYEHRGSKFVKLPRGQIMTAARAVWLYHYDKLPETRITFKDGNPLNHRVDNLLVEGKSLQERMNIREDSHAYLWGQHARFYPRTGKWRVRVKNKHLGYYATQEEAEAVAAAHIESLKTAPLL